MMDSGLISFADVVMTNFVHQFFCMYANVFEG